MLREKFKAVDYVNMMVCCLMLIILALYYSRSLLVSGYILRWIAIILG